MKRKFAMLLAVLCTLTPIIPVQASHWATPNPYTAKEPTTEQAPVEMKGPVDYMVPTNEEFLEWDGEIPDEKPDPIKIPYDEINTFMLERLFWYFRYTLNIEEFYPATIIAAYNYYTEEEYPNPYLKLNYPIDAREIAYKHLEDQLDEVLNWQKQEYWAMWRRYGRDPKTDISAYFNAEAWADRDDADEIIDEDYQLTKIQAARLHAYMCQGLINMMSYKQHPNANLRSNTCIYNDLSLLRDYSFYKGNVWDYASTSSKWYVRDMMNYWTGEVDICFGTENARDFVDQNKINSRHNNRLQLDENSVHQKNDISGAINMYSVLSHLKLAKKGSPSTEGCRYVKGYEDWLMGVIRKDSKYRIEVKFKEGMYDTAVSAILASGDPGKILMVKKYSSSLYWMIHYWIDNEYVKYDGAD